ncbi:acyl-CoA dehydrogenase family protein [Streptomyces sp. SAI-144]|uniref:acyl-CoA dehydrogenase family protein n=1 Tax=Streptomyces sp. SAI-144 TaxID=2940544 RepID=UPI002473C6A1|nr:acyl-CoA dehydrogenase family protein [Streptomyces sp. SAI-144]
MHQRHPDIDPQLLSETEEQRELRTVLRDFFTEESGPEAVRRHLATPRGHDEKLWARLAGEIGVHGLAIPEEFGGSGFTFAELAVALEESGRALYCAPLLPTVVLAAHALLNSADQQACARYLPRIAAGTLTATVAGFEEAEPGVGVVARAERAGVGAARGGRLRPGRSRRGSDRGPGPNRRGRPAVRLRAGRRHLPADTSPCPGRDAPPGAGGVPWRTGHTRGRVG